MVEPYFSIIQRRPGSVTVKRASGATVVPIVNLRKAPIGCLERQLLVVFFLCVIWRAVGTLGVRRALEKRVPWISAQARAFFSGDIRGGDSFSDIYGLKRFLEGSLPALMALILKCPLVQFPQTYGPFKSGIARSLARFLLRKSVVVIARDKASQAAALDLVQHSRTVLLSPDVAFALEPIAPGSVVLDVPDPGFLVGRPFGLNVNGLLYRGGYNRKNMFGLKLDYPTFLRELVIRFLSQHREDVLLFPHTWAPAGDVESDNEACEELKRSLPDALRDRVRIVAAEYDANEIKWIIGQCRFVVAARMHACIAALSQGVPAVGVAYSMKFRGVFETVGMEDWVMDGREMNSEEAISAILTKYANSDSVRPGLLKSADKARADLDTLFRSLVDGTLIPKRDVR